MPSYFPISICSTPPPTRRLWSIGNAIVLIHKSILQLLPNASFPSVSSRGRRILPFIQEGRYSGPGEPFGVRCTSLIDFPSWPTFQTAPAVHIVIRASPPPSRPQFAVVLVLKIIVKLEGKPGQAPHPIDQLLLPPDKTGAGVAASSIYTQINSFVLLSLEFFYSSS